MTFAWTPEQLAVSSALGAMDTAQKTLEAQIKLCGELSAADAKQSDTNKRYFAEQAEASALDSGITGKPVTYAAPCDVEAPPPRLRRTSPSRGEEKQTEPKTS